MNIHKGDQVRPPFWEKRRASGEKSLRAYPKTATRSCLTVST